jgi:sulfhydrogenase subunit beta (sulfur reductase)
MKVKVLDRDRLSRLIDLLLEKYRVFAPVKRGRLLRFQEISSGKEACLDFQNTKQPPKEVFFPQTEILFTYKKNEKGVEVGEPPSDGERVLFGIRPCDARGLVLFDKFFSSGEHKDPPYLDKREETAVVGLACNRPLSTCFCTSVGGSPFGKEGLDLLLVDLGDRYLVEILTERGERLVEKARWLRDASDADLETAERLSRDAESAIKTKLLTEGLSEKLDGMFDDPLWDRIYQKCAGCGVCTYLCPTCWCFDILDEETPTGVKRVRVWDTCQFPLFTKQASGFNPRPSGKERMRQRVMHKFNYFPTDFGEFACVGCGRCVRECSVNLDIREVIKDIMSV